MDKAPAKVKEACMAKDEQARAERLAAALRENLKRRKAQARETASSRAGGSPADVTPGLPPAREH